MGQPMEGETLQQWQCLKLRVVLKKDALNRWPTRKAILHPQLITYNQDVIIQIDISQKKKPSYPNPVGRPKCTRVSKSQQKSHKKIAAVCKVDADGCY